MKIYLVGAHCTGKTTLAKFIADRYNIDIVSEVVRKIVNEMEGDLNDVRTDMFMVDWLQEEILDRQHDTEANIMKDNFVSDRGMDFLAYTAEYSNITHDIRHNEAYKRYIEWLKEDSIVFFLRPHKTLLNGVDDGFRKNLSWESICRIDGMIKFILELEEIDYIQINTDIFQEKIRLVESVLKLKGV